MKKILFKNAIKFLFVLFIFSAACGYLLNSTKVLRLGVSIIPKITSSTLLVKNIKGSFLGPIEIKDFKFENKKVIVKVDEFYLDWSLLGLFIKNFSYSKLHIKNLDVFIKYLKNSNDKPSSVSSKKNITKALQKLLDLFLMFDDLKLYNLNFKFGSAQNFLKLDNIQMISKTNDKQIESLKLGLKISKAKYNTISTDEVQFNFDFSRKGGAKYNLSFKEISLDSIVLDQLDFSGSTQKVDDAVKTKISLKPFKIFFKEIERAIKFKTSILKGEFTKKELAIEAEINFEKNSPLNLKISIPAVKNFSNLFLSQPVKGKLIWGDELSFLGDIFPQIKPTNGNVDLSYKLSGTLNNPVLTGSIKIDDAKVKFNKYNTVLENINVNLESDNSIFNYQGSLKSGGGKLAFSGYSDFKNHIDHKIHLNGTRFLLSNNKEYKVFISPDIVLQTKENFLDITGKVFVPKANISPAYLKGGSSLPPEITYVDATNKDGQLIGYDLSAKIDLDLGDDVFVDMMGLKGNLHGRIQIDEHLQENAKATGVLYIKNGKYDAYGQKLKITKGKMNFFGGDLDNPRLDIEAIRKFESIDDFALHKEDLIVGLKVDGLLQTPKVELFSKPLTLSSADILSYIVFGQSSKQVSEDKTQILLRALSALNFTDSSKVNNMLGKFKNALYLDEFGVAAKNNIHDIDKNINRKLEKVNGSYSKVESNSSFAFGKYLSPRLYLNYSIGLTEPVSILKVKYFMGRHWTIETENSRLNNGIDLFYNISYD